MSWPVPVMLPPTAFIDTVWFGALMVLVNAMLPALLSETLTLEVSVAFTFRSPALVVRLK